MGTIRLPGRILSILRALAKPLGGELFTVAAVLDKCLFQRSNLTVQQVVRLVDQADCRIGADHGIRVIEPSAIKLPALRVGEIRQIGPIRLIRPIGPILAKDLGHVAHPHGLRAIGIPLRQTPVTQEILVIKQQFIQARAGDVYKAQLGLRRGGRRPAALGEVLPT